MKNDLETCAEEYSALLDQACMNVGADLFEDQIEIFDLAMAKARFSAAMSLANHAGQIIRILQHTSLPPPCGNWIDYY